MKFLAWFRRRKQREQGLDDGELVTGNYFSGLGVTPILGRA